MQLVSLTLAASSMDGLATMSQYFFIAGLCTTVIMSLTYLWYTFGTARLAKQLALAEQQSSTEARTQKAASQANLASSEGGIITLTRPDLILQEQPDGEKPIPLNLSLLTLGRIGTAFGWLTVLLLGLSQLCRTLITQHAPWSNLYEFNVSFTFALLLSYLIFEVRFHERVRAWGLYVCTLALVTLLIAVYLGVTYKMTDASSQLIPALQDKPILALHVSMAILAYALLCVSFGAGLVILLQNGQGQRFAWLPSAEAADELGYKAVIIGFPLLALTLILGAYWANYAWGHYWSWDPKETSALITWLIYAVYLHARGIRGWRGKRAGWLLTLGFAATLFTYYGVNFLISGLHSYATPK